MKLMTAALLATFVLGAISPDVLARGSRGGSGKRSYSSHSYKVPSKSKSSNHRQTASGSHASGSQAGDSTCYTGPRGGRYTLTPSGRKNYNGC